MNGSGSGSRIRDERQLRGRLEDIRRDQQRANEEDIIVEHPRRLFLRSPNGHFWLLGVDNSGALTTTDMGTSL